MERVVVDRQLRVALQSLGNPPIFFIVNATAVAKGVARRVMRDPADHIGIAYLQVPGAWIFESRGPALDYSALFQVADHHRPASGGSRFAFDPATSNNETHASGQQYQNDQ